MCCLLYGFGQQYNVRIIDVLGRDSKGKRNRSTAEARTTGENHNSKVPVKFRVIFPVPGQSWTDVSTPIVASAELPSKSKFGNY